jgi:hypothetical protein
MYVQHKIEKVVRKLITSGGLVDTKGPGHEGNSESL